MRQRLLFVIGIGLLCGAAAPAAAQTRFDLGVNGGFSWWSPFVGEDQTGNGSVSLKTGWLLGAQATAWLTERIGLRPNFAFEDRALKASDGTLFTGADGARSLDHVNLWAPSLDLLFRLKKPSAEFVRGEWIPFVAVGGGIRYINPAGDNYTTFDFVNSEVWPGVPFGISGTSVDTLFLSELSTGMGLVALGSDLRMAPHFAIRMELGEPDAKGRRKPVP
ncbi:MAG: hypothetical protein FIB01_09360, partial [Gemmatimonadetes bacterium]|nr:hypothetical protein [Gemmatimonadota bacterium]